MEPIVSITYSSAGDSSIWSSIADAASIFIAIAAVAISIIAYRSNRQHMRAVQEHAKLSVQPAFTAWADYPSEKNNHVCTLTVSNKGFGPAMCERMSISAPDMLSGESDLDTIRKGLRAAFDRDIEILESAYVSSGFAIGPGENIILAKFRNTEITEQEVTRGLDRIKLHVFYRDIHKNHWKFEQLGTLVSKTVRMQNPALYD